MSEKIVRILFLDDAPWCLPDLSRHNIRLDVIQESTWETMDVYSAPPELCGKITGLTENQEVDLVVVGNNLGAGVVKAQAIAKTMRNKTIVVWNRYAPGDEAPYAMLGLRHFGSRIDLRKMIPDMLGI